jgi:hypothetical protein
MLFARKAGTNLVDSIAAYNIQNAPVLFTWIFEGFSSSSHIVEEILHRYLGSFDCCTWTRLSLHLPVFVCHPAHKKSQKREETSTCMHASVVEDHACLLEEALNLTKHGFCIEQGFESSLSKQEEFEKKTDGKYLLVTMGLAFSHGCDT